MLMPPPPGIVAVVVAGSGFKGFQSPKVLGLWYLWVHLRLLPPGIPPTKRPFAFFFFFVVHGVHDRRDLSLMNDEIILLIPHIVVSCPSTTTTDAASKYWLSNNSFVLYVFFDA